jgi:hypothetical protein
MAYTGGCLVKAFESLTADLQESEIGDPAHEWMEEYSGNSLCCGDKVRPTHTE